MANVIIEHEDGRRYSTSRAGFEKLYADQGFKIVGEETDASFQPVGIPTPKAPRRQPKAKKAATKKAIAKVRAEAAAAAEPAPADVISPPQIEGEPV